MVGDCRDPRTGRTFECPDDPSDPFIKLQSGTCSKSRSHTPVRCPTDEAWHRAQDAKLADEKAEYEAQQATAAAERQARFAMEKAEQEGRLKEATAKRDLSDVVAQVLNYTSNGIDEGSDVDFWYRPDPAKPCVYQRSSVSLDHGIDRLGNSGLIDLNAIDPQTLGMGDKEFGDTAVTVVFYDAAPLLISSRQLDQARLARGWALIYKDGHCEGLKRAF